MSKIQRKILKPIKFSKQRKESVKDAETLVDFMISMISDSNENKVITNELKFGEKFLNNPKKISSQMIKLQDSLGIEDATIRGKRVYPMTYIFPETEFNIGTQEGCEIATEFLGKYEKYQGVVIVSENEKGSIYLNIIFNNYACDGSMMTKDFRAYHMTNIFNKRLSELGKVEKNDGV